MRNEMVDYIWRLVHAVVITIAIDVCMCGYGWPVVCVIVSVMLVGADQLQQQEEATVRDTTVQV